MFLVWILEGFNKLGSKVAFCHDLNHDTIPWLEILLFMALFKALILKFIAKWAQWAPQSGSEWLRIGAEGPRAEPEGPCCDCHDL